MLQRADREARVRGRSSVYVQLGPLLRHQENAGYVVSDYAVAVFDVMKGSIRQSGR